MKKKLLSSAPRLFTAEEATRTLPLVSAIFSDLLPLWRSVNGTQQRIRYLADGRDIKAGNLYAEEVAAMGQKVASDSRDVEALIDELRQLGVEFRTDGECHACFPAMLDGRLVYLSWMPGELEVAHWMELDGEVADRHSLATSVGPAS